MEKMNLPLRQFITLIGPAQKVVILDEERNQEREEEPLYSGVAAKLRDELELLEREVKLIVPVTVQNKAAFKIWIY